MPERITGLGFDDPEVTMGPTINTSKAITGGQVVLFDHRPGYGRVINISSILADRLSINQLAYASSSVGVNDISRIMALQGEDGRRCCRP